MNYEKAVATLKNRPSKKVANNTYLIPVEGGIAVKLHQTNVVTFLQEGTVILNSGGWRTVTTKDRINNFSPARVYSDKGVWFVYYKDDYGSKTYQPDDCTDHRATFFDGMAVDANGIPLVKDTGEEVMAAKRRLDRMITRYINGYASHVLERGNLEAPGLGDCLMCRAAQPENENPLGLDHLLSHIEEGYYVPSLLWSAIRSRGYRQPDVVWMMADHSIERGDTRGVKDALSSYLRKLKPALLTLMTAQS